LETSTGTWTAEFLWLGLSAVSDQEGSIVVDEGLLEFVLGLFVDVLLVEGDDTLGNGLTDGVDLGSVATTGDSDSDVEVSELVKTNEHEWLVELGSEDLWLDQGDWLAVDLDHTLAGLDVGDGSGGLLLAKGLDAWSVSLSFWHFVVVERCVVLSVMEACKISQFKLVSPFSLRAYFSVWEQPPSPSLS
jgi:hypothetical protein